MRQVASNHLSPTLFRPSSRSPEICNRQTLTRSNRRIRFPLLHMLKPTQSRFPHLLYKRSNSHLTMDHVEVFPFTMDHVEEYGKQLESIYGPEVIGSDLYNDMIESFRKHYEPPEDPGNYHVRATPLLDVLCVTVHGNKSDDCERPFEICGTIQLVDENNYAYDVYNRESDNPETVSPGGNLSLTHPDGTPSCIFLPYVSSLKMQVRLRDAAQDKEIANQVLDLKLMDKVGYEKIKIEDVQGHDGFASVQYFILPYAVIANVELRLVKEDGSDFCADIYGSISATSKVQEGNISSVLLQKPPCEPIMVDLNTPLRLSKPVLAVPAYSSLQIKANLWDYHTKQQIASDVIVANCEAHDYRLIKQDCILGQNYHFKVKIDWSNAYIQLFDEGSPIHKPQLLCDQHPSSALSNRVPLLYMDELLLKQPPMDYVEGLSLVELFSIIIYPDKDVNLRLCGKIEVYDSNDSYLILERDNSNPMLLGPDKKIESLKWPNQSFWGSTFGMRLHLTDAEGREVCKGSLDWDLCAVEFPISWYYRRISSVIRGEYGYATVHYAIFRNAVEARVKVVFISNTCSSSQVTFKVYGDIVARNSRYCERNKDFESRLFGGDDYAMVTSGSPLMLQKSIVSLPGNSSLILDVKLQAATDNAKNLIQICETLEFKIDLDNTSLKIIEGKGFHVQVLVEWIDVFD